MMTLKPEEASLAVFVFGAIARMQVRFSDRCCCCADPRSVVRFGSDTDGEWMHLDDETFAEMRHIHAFSSGSDCDGHHEHGSVYTIPSIRREALVPWHRVEDATPEFRDLWMYLVRHEPDFSEGLELTVGDSTLNWSCPTDEGAHGGHLQVCEDAWCDLDDRHYRDQFAEAAGY